MMSPDFQAELRARPRVLDQEVAKSKNGDGTLPDNVVEQYEAALFPKAILRGPLSTRNAHPRWIRSYTIAGQLSIL